jgi:hypothetical protein
VAFFGMLLTAFGSAYYHVAPDNAHLVWDRIPMTIVFGALIAAVIAERISFRTGLLLLPFLIAIGVGSVLQWYASELHGHGDLRFYAAVQAYSTIVLLLALLLPPKYFARLGFCGGGGILCPGESPGACRLSSLRVRPHCQRAYVEASSCGGGGVLDLANVAA